MFSKAALDILPPYYLYNYKIKLIGDNNLKVSPLYSYLSKELKILKQYLVNNLNKEFIKAS